MYFSKPDHSTPTQTIVHSRGPPHEPLAPCEKNKKQKMANRDAQPAHQVKKIVKAYTPANECLGPLNQRLRRCHVNSQDMHDIYTFFMNTNTRLRFPRCVSGENFSLARASHDLLRRGRRACQLGLRFLSRSSPVQSCRSRHGPNCKST